MADSDLKRTHPLTIITKTLKVAWQAFFGLFFVLIASSSGGAGAPIAILIGISILAMLIGVGASWVAWTRFGYGVIGPDLVVVEGLLIRKRRVIPIARVHGVNVRASLFMRLFGLVEVVVQTAGGGANEPEASIGAIRLADAEALRNELLHERRSPAQDRAGDAAPTTVADEAKDVVGSVVSTFTDPESVAGADPVGRISDFRGAFGGAETLASEMTFEYKVPLGHLLIGAITSNRVPIMLLVFFGVGGQLIEVVGSTAVERTASAAISMGIVALAALIVGIVLFTLLVAVISTVAKDYGFVARRYPTRIETEAGLLERRQLGIPVTRVQAVRIEESWLRKLLGLAMIHVDTAGLERGSRQGPQANAGSKAMVPIAKREDLRRLMHGLLPEAEEFPLERPIPPRALRFYLVIPLALTILIGVAPVLMARWLYPPATPFVVVGIVIALGTVGWTRTMQWRAAGLGRDEHAITMRSGVIGRKRVRLSRSRIQSLTVRQNPFQKHRGLATLVAATVSGSAHTNYAVHHLAEDEAWRTIDWYEQRTQAASA